MRSMFYFPDVTLPDGAEVTSATVHLQGAGVAGSASGQATYMYPITKGWSNTDSTNWASNAGSYDATTPSINTPIPSGFGTGTNVSWDVTAIARKWYTRRGADWLSDVGFMLKFNSEASGEVEILHEPVHQEHRGDQAVPVLVLVGDRVFHQGLQLVTAGEDVVEARAARGHGVAARQSGEPRHPPRSLCVRIGRARRIRDSHCPPPAGLARYRRAHRKDGAAIARFRLRARHFGLHLLPAGAL